MPPFLETLAAALPQDLAPPPASLAPAPRSLPSLLAVAVSGGADSTALLRGLATLLGPANLRVLHVNHHLRGPESDADEHFVRETCREIGVPCDVAHVDPATLPGQPDGLEAAARTARYALLRQLAEQHAARYLATAHTADDQAETVLHRLVRGTGIAGLAGIPRLRPLSAAVTLVRPLLQVRRSEVLAYLADLGQPFREDATNAHLRHTRNRLRHDILPRLVEINPEVVAALCRLAEQADQTQQLLHTQVAPLLAQALVAQTPSEVTLNCLPLATTPTHLVCELFIALWKSQSWPQQSMTHSHWRDLATLAQTPTPGQQTFPQNIHATRTADRLHLEARGWGLGARG